jgi:cytochrome c-type biogenesis protein CcmH
MNAFVLIAAPMVLLVIVPLLVPLLRRSDAAPNAAVLSVVLVVIIGGGAALLYPAWSNWRWSEPAPAADSPAAMIGRLARRLEKQPDDLDGWLLLGKSYAVVEQFPLSARAYQRAGTLAAARTDEAGKQKHVEALMGLGDALINGGTSDFGGRAGRLYEQALEISPNLVKALFYSAIAAVERNDLPLAKARFTRLLDGNPPPEVRGFIEQQIQAIDAQAVLASRGPAAAPGASIAGAAATSQAAAPSTAAAASAVSVPLRVTLSASVSGKAAAGAPLFVLARIPGQRGPPLAAKRLEAKFPQDVDLLSTDAMLSGTGFNAGQEIEIEARIANGGSAISRSGDPFGIVRVRAGSGQRAAIDINQLKP